jgi:hypothetical protein
MWRMNIYQRAIGFTNIPFYPALLDDKVCVIRVAVAETPPAAPTGLSGTRRKLTLYED